jgi:hypothetical protein
MLRPPLTPVKTARSSHLRRGASGEPGLRERRGSRTASQSQPPGPPPHERGSDPIHQFLVTLAADFNAVG